MLNIFVFYVKESAVNSKLNKLIIFLKLAKLNYINTILYEYNQKVRAMNMIFKLLF